jgi:hypothetical protein
MSEAGSSTGGIDLACSWESIESSSSCDAAGGSGGGAGRGGGGAGRGAAATFGGGSAGFGALLEGSSSAMILRMEARISSIEGS